MNITIERSQAGRVDEQYSSGTGWITGVAVRYSFLDWFALRAEIDVADITHRMDRNIHYLDLVYTTYHNTYLMMPVMADVSFGGRKIRGHLLIGGFAGFWIAARRNRTPLCTLYTAYLISFGATGPLQANLNNLNYGGSFGNSDLSTGHYVYTSDFETDFDGQNYEGKGIAPDMEVIRKSNGGSFKAAIDAALKYIEKY